MRSTTSSSPARRTLRQADQRARRRPAVVLGGMSLAALTCAAVTGAATVSTPAAAGALANFSLASSAAPAAVTATAVEAVAPQNDLSPAASDTLTAAQTALDAAAGVTAEIQASGLDVGDPNPTVDTTALTAAVTRLQSMGGSLAPFAADVAEDIDALVAPVSERATQLRGSLEGAQLRKAEEEAAAEKARQEAEAAAAAAAAAATRPATPAPARPTASAPAPVMSGGSAGEAQAIARGMLGSYGWGDDQFGCLVSLWQKESGWNYRASNPSSGAYGIPQALPGSKMASAGADWQTNPATQIAWGFGYISGRYGTPCGAWAKSQSSGWY